MRIEQVLSHQVDAASRRPACAELSARESTGTRRRRRPGDAASECKLNTLNSEQTEMIKRGMHCVVHDISIIQSL